MKIQFIDLQRQYQNYKTEIDRQIEDVLSTSSYIMGPKIKELEQALAKFVGVEYAIGCASGTDALLLGLMAYDIQPGDEIITTPFSFISTCEVIALLKAKPVFVDIDEFTYNIDPSKIKAAITNKTKGIIAVDLFGQCAEYNTIMAIADEYKLFVIEDAAQSFGASYKNQPACSFGHVACTSFFPAKPLGCFGDGGMVFTQDQELAEKITSLRVHGKGQNKYDNVRIGLNARLDTLQAAILLAKFQFFPKEIDLRNEVAGQYSKQLSEYVEIPKILNHNISVFAQYSLQSNHRKELQNYLKEKGVPTAIYYPKALHLQDAFQYLGCKEGAFPVTEKISQNIFSIPMHPYLTEEEQGYIIKTIKSFFEQ